MPVRVRPRAPSLNNPARGRQGRGDRVVVLSCPGALARAVFVRPRRCGFIARTALQDSGRYALQRDGDTLRGCVSYRATIPRAARAPSFVDEKPSTWRAITHAGPRTTPFCWVSCIPSGRIFEARPYSICPGQRYPTKDHLQCAGSFLNVRQINNYVSLKARVCRVPCTAVRGTT